MKGTERTEEATDLQIHDQLTVPLSRTLLHE